MQGHAVENGRSEGVVGLAGAVGVETNHREDGPRRHGAAVLVARNTVRRVLVILVEQACHLFLRAPLLAFEVAEQVGIGDIGLVGGVIEILVKHPLQLVDKSLLAAHEACQSLHIVGHVEGVVPGRALVESGSVGEVGAVLGVKRGEPGAVGVAWAQGSKLLVVIVLVAE